jgi:hypothetical protein
MCGGVWEIAGEPHVQGGDAAIRCFVSVGVGIRPCECVHVMSIFWEVFEASGYTNAKFTQENKVV